MVRLGPTGAALLWGFLTNNLSVCPPCLWCPTGLGWLGTIHRFVSRSLIMWDCRMECPAGLVTCGLSTTVTQAHCLLVRPEFYRNKIRPLINDCYHCTESGLSGTANTYIFHFNRANWTSCQSKDTLQLFSVEFILKGKFLTFYMKNIYLFSKCNNFSVYQN